MAPSGKVIGVMWAVAFIGDSIGQQIMGSHFKACQYGRFGPTILLEFCLAAVVLVIIRCVALPAAGKAPRLRSARGEQDLSATKAP